MTSYLQGETISFKMRGTMNLSETDFKVLIASDKGNWRKLFSKSDLTAAEDYYQGTISPSESKKMPKGNYFVEVMLTESDTVILHAPLLYIGESTIKEVIQ